MQKPKQFNEKQMRYIQRTLKVSRKELIETITMSRISADIIAQYLKKKKTGFTTMNRFPQGLVYRNAIQQANLLQLSL